MSNGKSKEEICKKIGVSTRTFERFLHSLTMSVGESEGSSHQKFYSDEIVSQFKKWLKHNQFGQGVECGSKNLLSEIKASAGGSNE